LSGTQIAASTSFNYTLTVFGTTDWVHWGYNGVFGTCIRKANGGQFSQGQTWGSGNFAGNRSSQRNTCWSDGTPVGSDADDNGYVSASGNPGAGFAFTAPASTTSHTLWVYAGGYSSGSTLTAHLSDGSAADYVVSSSGSGSYNNIIEITYHAASPGQTLTITYVKSQNINGTSGSADLVTAWLR
jgi:hypothetical protein